MICYSSTKKNGNEKDTNSLKMHTILPIDRNLYIEIHDKYKHLSFVIDLENLRTALKCYDE